MSFRLLVVPESAGPPARAPVQDAGPVQWLFRPRASPIPCRWLAGGVGGKAANPAQLGNPPANRRHGPKSIVQDETGPQARARAECTCGGTRTKDGFRPFSQSF